MMTTLHPTRFLLSKQPNTWGRWALVAFAALLLLAIAPTAYAGEAYSNGLGGGLWSDGSTWRGGKVPVAEDDVTIARGDTVTFDRDDSSRISCNKLYIDPHGTLTFKTTPGKNTMVLSGAIETYGKIVIDSARIFGNLSELRLAGETDKDRTIAMMRGSAISVIGKRFTAPSEATAIISSIPKNQVFTETSPSAYIQANGNVSVDIRNARLDATILQITKIDNTSAVAGERLNVVGNTFTGRSQIYFYQCDTPTFTDNTFINKTESRLGYQAVHILNSQLPAIRNNHIAGTFSHAFLIQNCSDPLFQNNTVENAETGAYFPDCSNIMIINSTFKNCGVGLNQYRSGGVIRECVFDHCPLPIYTFYNTQQLINIQIINPVEDKPYLDLRWGRSVLINTNISQANIKLSNRKTENETVISNQPLIVKVKGNIPAGAMVQVTPIKDDLPWKTNEPPVIRAPAPIDPATGLTPSIASGRAILVRSWALVSQKNETDIDNIPAPDYKVEVIGPQPSPNKEAPVLASVTVRPDDSWCRADLSDTTPMLEITLP